MKPFALAGAWFKLRAVTGRRHGAIGTLLA